MGPALDLLNEVGVKLASESITREALIKELFKSTATIQDPNGKISFHSSLTILSMELTVFLGYQNRQLMSDLTDWFDCRDQWTYRTKLSGSDELIGVWVNLLGGTTPDLINVTIPLEAIGAGLTSRIIFVYEPGRERSIVLPYADPELRKSLLHDLEIIKTLHGDYKYREDYFDAYSTWYLGEGSKPVFDDPYFAGYSERRATHMSKLSMICNAARSNEMILEEQDFKQALTYLLHVEKKMPYTFKGVGKNVNADVTDRLLTTLAASGKMSMTEIVQRFYKDADQETLQKILMTLKAMGAIDINYEGNKTYVEYKRKSKSE